MQSRVLTPDGKDGFCVALRSARKLDFDVFAVERVYSYLFIVDQLYFIVIAVNRRLVASHFAWP